MPAKDPKSKVQAGASTPVARKGFTGRLRRPKGEADALANLDREGRGADLNIRRGGDPVIERALEVTARRAAALGLELGGQLWAKPGRKGGCEVHAGRPKLGFLTQEQLVAGDVEPLFMLHRAVWLDVVAPSGLTWPEWSAPLFAAQWALGQLMDAALDDLRLALSAGWHPFKAGHKKTECVECGRTTESHVPLQTMAYRGVTNKARQDGLRADASRRFAKSKATSWRARSEFSLSGGTTACAGNIVHTFFGRWRNGEIGYPSWSGPNSAIYVRNETLKLGIIEVDGEEQIECVLKVLADGVERRCIVSPKGHSAETQVRRILKGEYAHGNACLVWDERKRRWRVSLSYTMPRQPTKIVGPRVLAVRRSVTNLLFVMDSAGQTNHRTLRGAGLKILGLKQQFTRRKSDQRSMLNAQGGGAHGHGRKRFFRLYQRLKDKEARAIDSNLKQLASHIRRAAQDDETRASLVLLERFTGDVWEPTGSDPRFVKLVKRMPWAKVENLLKLELEEHGIRLKFVEHAKLDACPACGSAIEFKDENVECVSLECGLFVQREMAATWALFNAAGVKVEPELPRKAGYIARALRERDLERAKALGRDLDVKTPSAAE